MHTAHFWSLAVEEQFYLIGPAVVYLLSGRQLKSVCIALMVGSPVIRLALGLAGLDFGAYAFKPARMGALAIGVFLALIAREPGGLDRVAWLVRPAAVLSAAAFAVAVWLPIPAPAGGLIMPTTSHTALAVLFGALLIRTMTGSAGARIRRVLRHGALVSFGRYSYALYVFHPLASWYLYERHVLALKECLLYRQPVQSSPEQRVTASMEAVPRQLQAV